ncbi:MAG: cell division protein ZapA [Candidatus Nitricoxidivorans perseverans]|uniref:Cell division protein ZapA n=1 Tax=Candidatus Nitricoxidivorans perseverans TaxID=2975601 RepID=A0AA49FJ44_9PROT|nr:MAG: cell division protein ZapA [Candidatus Nitricoxidivorans perseverans]
MSAPPTLDIKLNGREFRVACTPGEREPLLAAVAFLDGRMTEIAKQTRNTGERLAVMTALDLAHELTSLKRPQTTLDDVPDFRRRIVAMEARLDEALAHQEDLF